MPEKKDIFIFSILASSFFAQTALAQSDIMTRYRAQGGLLPVENSAPPTGLESGGSDPSSLEGSERRMADFLATGTELNPDKIDGFNQAIDQAFPMTPEMIKRYREILKMSEEAAQITPEPKEKISTTLVSLEPGEPAPLLKVSPSIATVIGFYDASGAPWAISEFILGNSEKFQAALLGDGSNNIALSPRSRIGFTNMIVMLQDHPKPVTIRINIDEQVADYRFDVQVMDLGPSAKLNNAALALTETVTEAGNSALLAALSGVDLPKSAKSVGISGVNARGWLIEDHLYIRSRHAMLSPSWTESMSGPDGIRIYKIEPASVVLFSVNGQIIRADVELP